MSASNYLEQAQLDHEFGKAAFASPTVYLGLLTAAPGDDAGSLSEAAYTGYARKQTAASDWTRTDSSMANANVLAFPAATGGDETATHFATFDAATNGNMLRSGLLGSGHKQFVALATDTFASPAHGFSNNDAVRLFGDDLPTGVDGATLYYIINATTDTFQLSATEGGAAIDITAAGSGTIAVDGALQISNGITPQFAAGALTFTND